MFVLSDLADAVTLVIPEDRNPSLSELADQTGLGTATVKRHLTLLEEGGWVVRDRPTVVAARTEHARTGYQITQGLGSERAMPLAQSDPSPNGHNGQSMAQSEPRHGSERAKGLAQSEPVPYSPDTTQMNSNSSSAKPTKATPKPEPDRPDVEKICNHLADRIAEDGTKRPTITAKWRAEARLLLDRDGRTVDQVMRAIDWCQADPFWRGNILSMPKLRKQYETLRRHAQRPNGRASPDRHLVEHNGLLLKPETIADIERTKRFEAMEAERLAIGGPA